jgi:hypothetical protein
MRTNISRLFWPHDYLTTSFGLDGVIKVGIESSVRGAGSRLFQH